MNIHQTTNEDMILYLKKKRNKTASKISKNRLTFSSLKEELVILNDAIKRLENE